MKKKPVPSARNGDFESRVAVIVQIHHEARTFVTKAVNKFGRRCLPNLKLWR